MSSIIEGYNYDIFISYRQKDNKYDGWVTEFVDNLKRELEAAFKEDISVYFDINPHEGLHENHDVNESLKDKLKCLVFIPIISRTYCDPNSFAWEHEFRAFIEMASIDQFGLKVKVPGGNVANRVLPIRIYDLEEADLKLYEATLGGTPRGIDFIYSSAGVNRPLRWKEDNPNDNINRTYYRDQINKTVNSIKEIILGLRLSEFKPQIEPTRSGEVSIDTRETKPATVKNIGAGAGKKNVLIWTSTILILLLLAGIFALPQLLKPKAFEMLRSDKGISVVVMPFQNLTNDTTWNVWQDGIQTNLTTFLASLGNKDLKVRQTENVNSLLITKSSAGYASITPSIASSISQKLEADIVVNGTISKAGNTIRLNSQVIDSRTEEVLKSFQTEGPAGEESIFMIIDKISSLVRDYLIVSDLSKDLPSYTYYGSSLTNSPEAMKYFIYGKNDFDKLKYESAKSWLRQAISLDSNFVVAILQLAMAYSNQSIYPEGKKWCMKAYEKRSQMSPQVLARSNYIYARFFGTPMEKIISLRQLLEYDDQNPATYFNLGTCYDDLLQFDKAIPYFEKALEIRKKWGVKPFWVLNYAYLGDAYHKTGQYRKERKLYEKAIVDFPAPNERIAILRRQLILAVTEKDTAGFRRVLKEVELILNNMKYPEANTAAGFADIFENGNDLSNAESYYRKAFSLDPENGGIINKLAFFLIDKDRNISEGMQLIDKLLIADPENYDYLHTRGWALYKQRQYQEAKAILQKSWDMRMKNAVYDHTALLHLEEAKKAIADMKNN
jgi:tetratricopeptide (TPR) repeat protein